MGSSSQTQSSSGGDSNSQFTGMTASEPGWSPQANVLQNIFGQVPGALSQSQSAQLPSDFTAQMTPDQLALGQSELGSANSNIGAANGLIGTSSPYVSQGLGGAGSALSSLLGFNPSSTNNMNAVNNVANQYVQGQNIPAQVQQAMAGANQEADEVQLPGVNQQMTASGNQNSSRNALSQGLVQSNLANTAANMGSSMEGQAYAQGSQLGENMLANNNSMDLQGLNSALSGGLNLGNSGIYGMNGGISALNSLYGLGSTGAGVAQQNNQLGLQNALQQYTYGEAAPFAPLSSAMQVAGTTNWGPVTATSGTSNSTAAQQGNSETESQNPLAALSAIGGLMGSLGGI